MVVRQDDYELINQYLSTREARLKEEIILRYIPLVHFVLGRLGISSNLGQDYEDAVSQGILGLIESLERYDPSHGTQFSTYAILRIRGQIIDYLRSHDWLTRGARHRQRLVQEAIETLWVKYQRSPTDEELAFHLNMEIDKLKQSLIDSSHMIVSLDTFVMDEGDETMSLYELLPDENQTNPPELYAEQELIESLSGYLKSLPEREQLVLSLYYFEELTFKEIGAVMNISESRVCQLHARAILSLRSRLQRESLEREANTYYHSGREVPRNLAGYGGAQSNLIGEYR
jgi:RNA polymerase sigma factor for flagellar operon FliA